MINDLVNENKKLKESLEELKTTLKKEIKDEILQELRKENSVNSAMTSPTKETLPTNEIEERKKKKENLIIFHLPEPEHDDPKEREKEDTSKMSDIFEKILGVEDSKIIKSFRLGSRKRSNETDTKPRPLLIKIRHVDEKYSVLKNAKKVKTSDDPTIKSIWIAKDLTKAERETQKQNWIKKKESQTRSEEALN